MQFPFLQLSGDKFWMFIQLTQQLYIVTNLTVCESGTLWRMGKFACCNNNISIVAFYKVPYKVYVSIEHLS